MNKFLHPALMLYFIKKRDLTIKYSTIITLITSYKRLGRRFLDLCNNKNDVNDFACMDDNEYHSELRRSPTGSFCGY